MKEEYQQSGYLLKRDFFTGPELDAVEPILRRFHEQWLTRYRQYYETGSINSAYITHRDSLPTEDRATLFAFIASEKMAGLARALIPSGPAFMNTQLFFDPLNEAQENYWHRDIQYTPHSVEEQQKRIARSNALHFRVPLVDERGIELIPGTHTRWDDATEFETRMGENGRTPSDDLPGGKAIPLKRGDLLVFSGNMIHRGLYGGDRFTFDILFADADPEMLQYADPACLPNEEELETLPNRDLFDTALNALSQETGPEA